MQDSREEDQDASGLQVYQDWKADITHHDYAHKTGRWCRPQLEMPLGMGTAGRLREGTCARADGPEQWCDVQTAGGMVEKAEARLPEPRPIALAAGAFVFHVFLLGRAGQLVARVLGQVVHWRGPS